MIHEPVPEGVEPAVVLARLVAREHTVPVELPAALGARSDRLVGAGDSGDDFAALQVELFDALMTTFRWRTS